MMHTGELRRIAILNRGEPAIRFLRAAREYAAEREIPLEIVALYTDPDEGAPFVRLSDDAVHLGYAMRPAPAGGLRSAYCDAEHVIAHLRASRCDAVWPGWGFASEDPDFVARLEAAGIAFLGPSSDAMRLLGDKLESKRLATAAGVPLAPWQLIEGDDDNVREAARYIGYPLMVKASAGGGGRGIRKVCTEAELLPAVVAAREEVRKVFGQGGLFMEACVTGARHIEVQLVCGADGRATALGVRDCSIQRRHQKVIEEAPSPVLPPEVERQLCEASERLAESAGYVGVATAEFLYDPESRSCSFLEVNSRLQVEHTVTEMVTGTDLVKAQIDIARGLPWQRGTLVRGHAIEVRLYAEDTERGFAPSPGLIRLLRLPSGPGVRVDSGVTEGMVIASEFDPMIAKIIAWAPTRRESIARLIRALRELEVVIDDGATNKGFLLDLLTRAPFVDATADTAWLDRATLSAPSFETEALQFAGIIEYRVQRHADIQRFFAQAQSGIPRHLPAPDGVRAEVRLRGRGHAILVYALSRDRYLAGPEGALDLVTVEPTGPHSAIMVVGDGAARRRHTVLYAQGRAGISVEVDGSMHTMERVTGGVVKATAPAMVVHVAVREGATVRPGDHLCTLEAMKMEMSVFAHEGGVVRQVLCQANQHVTAGQALFVLEPAEDASSEPVALPAMREARRPLDRLLSGSPAELDALPEQDAHSAMTDLLATLRALMLGFDVPPALASGIEALLRDDHAFLALAHPDRWAPLAGLLSVFASTEGLFDYNLVQLDGEPAAVSAELSFYELCRRHHEGEAAAPAPIVPLLHRALSHYGVRAIEPGEGLREALWRLAVAHAHGERRHRLCSSILRVVLALHEAGASIDTSGDLADALEQTAQLASAAFPFVADTARQAAYVLFEQPRYVERRQSLEDTVERAVVAWQDGHGDDATAALSALAASRQSLLPLLVGRADPGTPAARALAPVILRRIFVGRQCEVRTEHLDSGTLTLRARVGEADVLALVSSATDVPRALSALGGLAPEDEVLAELIVHGEVKDGFAQRLEAIVVEMAAPPGVRRLAATWCGARDTMQHRTWEPRAGRLLLLPLLRDIHPEAARRIELERLAEFELERLDAPEQIYAFRARARTSPEDERVFVFTEARDLPELPLPPERDGELWELDQAWFEATRVLREHQSRRDPRRRLHWNRITVHVRPVVPLDAQAVTWIARRLEAPTRGLGLEKVIISARVPGPAGESRATEFVISKPGRHRLEVRERAPIPHPVRAMTPYELKVVRSRRVGCVYPYEIVRMLEGRAPSAEDHGPLLRGGAVPHPDMARGRFVEHDLDETGACLVPTDRAPGGNAAGVVVGVMTNYTSKHPLGMDRVLIASDPTMAMGALAEPECRRIIAALDLAETLRVPVEWLPVSAGARIAMDSGTENLDWTARVLRRIVEHTARGFEIHVIVAGVNVGAQSYWNAEATMLMHTRGVLIMTPEGSMVLTGKKALEVSGGVAAEDERGIGGFERIMGPNGQAQHHARDLGEAYATLFEHYRFTFRAPGEATPRRHPTTDPSSRSILEAPYQATAAEPFTTVGEIFCDRTNPGRKRPFAIRAIMKAAIDRDGGHLERWRSMGDAETAVVWDAHMGGHAVSLIGFESRPIPRRGRLPLDGPDTWTGGTLFPRSSKKVARAIRAASGVRPVVVLANLSGFDGSPESLRELQLEYGAEIGRAVVEFEGPFIFVVVGRYHGGAYVVFSKALNPSLVAIALEGSYASVIGGAPAAAVVFPREVRRRADADERVVARREALAKAKEQSRPRLREQLDLLRAQVLLEKQGEVAREFDATHTVDRAVEVGSLDAVIPPARLRPAIIEELDRATVSREEPAAPNGRAAWAVQGAGG